MKQRVAAGRSEGSEDKITKLYIAIKLPNPADAGAGCRRHIRERRLEFRDLLRGALATQGRLHETFRP